MRINTNIGALNAYNNLENTTNNLNDSLAKLSSGYRINKAADDAAGLEISNALDAQISGLQVASQNARMASGPWYHSCSGGIENRASSVSMATMAST